MDAEICKKKLAALRKKCARTKEAITKGPGKRAIILWRVLQK